MEGAAGFEDWELLHGPDVGVSVASFAHASAASAASRGADGRPDGVIRSDYFTLDSGNRSSRRSSSSDGDHEGDSLADSENPCWVEPDSGLGLLLEEPSGGGLGFAGAEFPSAEPGGFWRADESAEGQEAPPHEHIEGEFDSSASSPSEVAFSGIDPVGGEGQGETAYLEGNGETDVFEVGGVESGESNPGDDLNTTVAAGSLVERSNGNDGMEGRHVAKWEKAGGLVWWRLPMEILKFCAFRIKPVWFISIAAAAVGFVMLRRRLYRKKPKSRSIPLRVTLDDKRVSQFMVRAARLNEAFSAVRRVPVIRSTLPTAGVTPWPMVALR